MLFELKMGPETLVGVIGKNGHLYWGAYSVADLLRYKSPGYFSDRRTKMKVMDIMSEYWMETYPLQSLQKKIITNNRMLKLLEKSPLEHVQLFYDHLNRGDFYVQITLVGLYPYAKLCSYQEPHARLFFDWIEECKRVFLTTTTTTTTTIPTMTFTTSKPDTTPIDTTMNPATTPTPAATTPTATSNPDTTPAAMTPTPTPAATSNPDTTPVATPTPAATTADDSAYVPPRCVKSESTDPRFESLRQQYNEYGSPIYFATRSESPRYTAPSPPAEYTPYSPSCPPYTPAAQEEEAKPLPKAPTGGITIWMDGLPATKIFVFHGTEDNKYYRKED